MLTQESKKYITAEQEMYDGKFQKVLDFIESSEKSLKTFSIEHLPLILLKGRLYCYQEKYKEAEEIGELAHNLAVEYGNNIDIIDALLIKAHNVFFGKLRESLKILKDVESTFNTLPNDPSITYSRQYSDFLTMKFIIYRYTGDLKESFLTINKWLSIFEEKSKKLDLSYVYMQLSEAYLYDGKAERATDYAKKSLVLQRELGNQIGIASSLYFVGSGYFTQGEIDKGLRYCRESLKIPEISILTKLEATHTVGAIFKEKGELDRTIRFYNRAVKLARKEGYIEKYASILMSIGTVYRMKGDYEPAINYFNRSLDICEKINSLYGIGASLFYLSIISTERDRLEEARSYLPRLEDIAKKTQSIIWKSLYMLAKALILKKVKRFQSRSEAEALLHEIVKTDINLVPQLRLFVLVNLCDLLLEELKILNNEEIIKDLDPLIATMLDIAKKKQSYLWLAQIKHLQANLALIQNDFREAKKLMIQAQKIAEMHDLNILAIKISNEHDSMLDQSNLWNELMETKAPISERIKLASIDSLFNNISGKRGIEKLKIEEEEPKLLLIMSKDGIPHFTHSFQDAMDFEPLFSSFLSAFNSFGSELFSNSIDRINIGEYRILINPLENFLFCYVILGQSYLAKKKLSKFTPEVRNDLVIWNALKLSVKTGKMLEMHNPPVLGKLVNQIFYDK